MLLKSITTFIVVLCTSVSLVYTPSTFAQEETPEPAEGEDVRSEETPEPTLGIAVTPSFQTFIGRDLTFDLSGSTIPEGIEIQEVLWNFGDGIRTTGESVSHAYRQTGSYTVSVRLTTNRGTYDDTIEVIVFDNVLVLVTDGTAPEQTIEIKRREAALEGLLLLELRAKGGGPEAVIEEELTNQLVDARDALARANLLVTWTSGSVGANVLSKFSQRVVQSEEISLSNLGLSEMGIIMISDTPFGVLAPSAQAVFDRLRPQYVILTRPDALDLFTQELTVNQAQQQIVESPVSHRILGEFSTRTVQDLKVTNFMSFGLDFLVNRGVPVNNITLILMLPVIATILSFSRQIIGIKAFGIVTPAMTTLSFLVLGLEYGLIVFSAVLIAGTVTRIILRRLRLLYLPRMALVLSIVSLTILVLFGIGIVVGQTTLLSFSIFPILILTLLAEEFIAVQFKSGAKQALIITALTLGLAIACYFIVSWQLMRTVIISYPEIVLLSLPINIVLGRWTGLRLTEYFRFRKLLRYTQ